MIKEFLESIKVYDVGLTKIRVGNLYDGGYVTLKEVCEKTQAIYSYGVGDDIGFELDFVSKFNSIPVKLYDPTIDSMPKNNLCPTAEIPNFFEFKKEGIGEGYSLPKPFRLNSLLKMDIEWSEWSALELLEIKELTKFSQILIELHLIPVEGLEKKGYTIYFEQFHGSVQSMMNQLFFSYYSKTLELLNEFFYIYHIHANNSLPKVEVEGCTFPPLLELSLVRKDLVGKVKEEGSIFPVEGLDFPNKKDRPDIENVYPLRK